METTSNLETQVQELESQVQAIKDRMKVLGAKVREFKAQVLNPTLQRWRQERQAKKRSRSQSPDPSLKNVKKVKTQNDEEVEVDFFLLLRGLENKMSEHRKNIKTQYDFSSPSFENIKTLYAHLNLMHPEPYEDAGWDCVETLPDLADHLGEIANKTLRHLDGPDTTKPTPESMGRVSECIKQLHEDMLLLWG